MAKILYGAPVAEYLDNKVSIDVKLLKSAGVYPGVAIVRVGEKSDDKIYERNVIRRCESVGVNYFRNILPEMISQEELLHTIKSLNSDENIHGVLLFRPLPSHLDEFAVCQALSPDKDIDCITALAMANVFMGIKNATPPCTVQAVLEILDYYDVDCTGKNIVVVGRSLVIGKPIVIKLLGKNATVTVCHSFTVDLPLFTSGADIVIVAIGKAEYLTKEYFSPGQVVIDVGINFNDINKKLCGDVNFSQAQPVVDAITPVPGGVGTVTTSVLISNVVNSAKNAEKPEINKVLSQKGF